MRSIIAVINNCCDQAMFNKVYRLILYFTDLWRIYLYWVILGLKYNILYIVFHYQGKGF